MKKVIMLADRLSQEEITKRMLRLRATKQPMDMAVEDMLFGSDILPDVPDIPEAYDPEILRRASEELDHWIEMAKQLALQNTITQLK